MSHACIALAPPCPTAPPSLAWRLRIALAPPPRSRRYLRRAVIARACGNVETSAPSPRTVRCAVSPSKQTRPWRRWARAADTGNLFLRTLPGGLVGPVQRRRLAQDLRPGRRRQWARHSAATLPPLPSLPSAVLSHRHWPAPKFPPRQFPSHVAAGTPGTADIVLGLNALRASMTGKSLVRLLSHHCNARCTQQGPVRNAAVPAPLLVLGKPNHRPLTRDWRLGGTVSPLQRHSGRTHTCDLCCRRPYVE